MAKDYYEVLGVNHSSSDSEVKDAYRRLAVRWNPGDEKGGDKYKEIIEAFKILGDPKKRQTYDKYGEEGIKNTHESFETWGDLAVSAKNARPHSDSECTKSRKVPPIQYKFACRLEELYTGCVKKMKVTRSSLDESGMIKDKSAILKINVKPGWKAGTAVVFPEMGDAFPGKIPADLVFTMEEQPHPLFVRSGKDLTYTADITLMQALTGVDMSIPTLDGRKLKVRVYEVIDPGYVKVVPNEGMPHQKNPAQRGNLIIKFNIKFPPLTETQKEKIKKILSV